MPTHGLFTLLSSRSHLWILVKITCLVTNWPGSKRREVYFRGDGNHRAGYFHANFLLSKWVHRSFVRCEVYFLGGANLFTPVKYLKVKFLSIVKFNMHPLHPSESWIAHQVVRQTPEAYKTGTKNVTNWQVGVFSWRYLSLVHCIYQEGVKENYELYYTK